MQSITINPNRIDLDEAYMQMAEVWAKRSKANRLQVGALIVKDRQIISDGYNGMPAGDEDDVCEHYPDRDEYSYRVQWGKALPPLKPSDMITKREVLHAESNALLKLSENGGIGAQGATLYTTWSPCFECAKLIRQAKISRLVYRNQYRDGSGIEFLQTRGVVVDHLPGPLATAPQPVQPSAIDAPIKETSQEQKASGLPDGEAPAPAPRPAPPPRSSILQQIAAGGGSVPVEPRAPKEEPPKVDDPFTLPLVRPEGVPSDDEVEALLRQHAASINPASAPTPPAAAPAEGYRSSFL